MDRVYYFKELIALIVGLTIVLFPLVLRYLFYKFFRSNRQSKAKGKRVTIARKSPQAVPDLSGVNTSQQEPKKAADEHFIKRIQREKFETISPGQRSPFGPENVYPPVASTVESRTPDDTVLPENAFDHILGETDSRTPEDTVLPGATMSKFLKESDETVLPQSALDRIFSESRENDQVIPSQQFGQGLMETRSSPGAAGTVSIQERKSMRSAGWRGLDRLPPLKRAIVLSEILGSPKAIAPGFGQPDDKAE